MEANACFSYDVQGMDDEEDEDEVSDSGINPPPYTPPEIDSGLLPPEKVVIIEPTPETEQPAAEVVQPKKSKQLWLEFVVRRKRLCCFPLISSSRMILATRLRPQEIPNLPSAR